MKKQKRDYIAVVFVGAGSTYYRCSDKTEAAYRAFAGAKRDWKGLYSFGKKQTRQVNVWDVSGHDSVYWDHSGLYDWKTDELIDTHELVEVFA